MDSKEELVNSKFAITHGSIPPKWNEKGNLFHLKSVLNEKIAASNISHVYFEVCSNLDFKLYKDGNLSLKTTMQAEVNLVYKILCYEEEHIIIEYF